MGQVTQTFDGTSLRESRHWFHCAAVIQVLATESSSHIISGETAGHQLYTESIHPAADSDDLLPPTGLAPSQPCAASLQVHAWDSGTPIFFLSICSSHQIPVSGGRCWRESSIFLCCAVSPFPTIPLAHNRYI